MIVRFLDGLFGLEPDLIDEAAEPMESGSCDF